jgi:opacity protein-like surface antigen
MKVSLLASVAVAAMILAAPQASAGGYKPYVSVFGGAAVLTKNPHSTFTGPSSGSDDLLVNNPGYIIGGAFGVDWGNSIRTEIELSHARWGADKFHYYETFDGGLSGTGNTNGSVSATYLLGNAWVDLSHGSQITPYVGGGLGVGWANVSMFPGVSSQVEFSSSGFAFQLGAGVRFNVNDNLSIDAGYRFKDIIGLNYGSFANGPWTDTLTDTSLASHNFQIGLTYSF